MNSQLRLILSTLAATCGSFTVGLHAGSINSLAPVLTQFFNSSFVQHYNSWQYSPTNMAIVWSMYVLQVAIGGMFGNAFLAARCADSYGRRITMIWLSWASIPVLGISVVAYSAGSAELLIISRLLIGVILGCSQSVSSSYVMELAPPSQIGQLGVATAGMFWLGQLFAHVLTHTAILGTANLWYYAYLIFIAIVVGQLILLHFVAPESPSFLHTIGYTEAPFAVLKSVNKPETNIKQIMENIDKQLQMQKSNVHIGQLFTNGVALRRSAILACCFGAAIPLSGATAVVSFSTSIFKSFGYTLSSSVLFTVGTSCLGLLMTISTSFYIKRVNRRTIFLSSMMVAVVCLSIMTVLAYLFEMSGNTAYGWGYVVTANIYLAAYAGGFGAICWFISTELVPQNARVANQSLAWLSLNVTLIITMFTFWTLRSLIGSLSYIMFIVSISFIWLYVYFRLPETRDRDINNIIKDLVKPTIFGKNVAKLSIRPEEQ